MKLINIITFAGGFLMGAAGGILATRAHFKRIAQDEIDSVIEEFEPAHQDTPKEEKAEDPAPKNDISIESSLDQDETLNEIRKITRNYDAISTPPPQPKSYGDDVHVIDPAVEEDLGEKQDFDIVSYTYFADGVLTDENYEPISKSDIDLHLGHEWEESFNEWNDSIGVRNETLKMDYEILTDLRRYKDYLADKYGMEHAGVD